MALFEFFRFSEFSRSTPMKVRKTFAEALILSKINYCNMYGQLPEYLINRLQRVQNTSAGYVYGRHAKMLDVIKTQVQVTYMDGKPKCLM